MAFKLLVIIFSVFAILRSLQQYGKREASRYWAVVWSALWALVMLAALFPQGIDAIAAFAGVGRGADLLVYIAVLFLLYATYRSTLRQRRMEEEITELVRKIALDHPDRP